MATFSGRLLHYVFKIGDRGKNAFFFRVILGMTVLRHEEFKEGCEAQCNGPYENRWSKTMVGYGPESTHFALELTYNYGITRYDLGNDLVGVTIKSKEIVQRACQNNYHIDKEMGVCVLRSPDGYKFYIIQEDQPPGVDPIIEIALHCTNINISRKYWRDVLHLKVREDTCASLTLAYANNHTNLRLKLLCGKIDRANAYGRLAFAVPLDLQPVISDIITRENYVILKPLMMLETPGKATVRVIILSDPDEHEICFVDEEGFNLLSAVEKNAEKNLDKYIAKDPFQPKKEEDEG